MNRTFTLRRAAMLAAFALLNNLSGRSYHGIKLKTTLALVFVLLTSGAAHANRDMDALVGRWSLTTKTVSSAGIQIERFRIEFSKLGPYSYHAVSRNFDNGILRAELWYLPSLRDNRGMRNARRLEVDFYDVNGNFEGEGIGYWGRPIRTAGIASSLYFNSAELGRGEIHTTLQRRNHFRNVESGRVLLRSDTTYKIISRARVTGTYNRLP